MKKDKRRNEQPGDVRPGEFNNQYGDNQDLNQPENFEGEQGDEQMVNAEDQADEQRQGGRNRSRSSMQDQPDENQEEAYEDEEGFEDEEEGEEEDALDGASGKGFKQIEEVAKKVMAYMKEHSQEFDKKTIAKYAAVGVLMLYGMRKNSVLGSMLVSIAAGIITKYILEKTVDEKEQESAQAA